jgi:hypothetical protein
MCTYTVIVAFCGAAAEVLTWVFRKTFCMHHRDSGGSWNNSTPPTLQSGIPTSPGSSVFCSNCSESALPNETLISCRSKSDSAASEIKTDFATTTELLNSKTTRQRRSSQAFKLDSAQFAPSPSICLRISTGDFPGADRKQIGGEARVNFCDCRYFKHRNSAPIGIRGVVGKVC